MPSASSFPLAGIAPELGLDALRLLSAHAMLVAIAQRVLGHVLVGIDQAWLRRQFALARYPSGHAAHGWHQDGALGFDFARGDAHAADALLPMLVCWCPLVACGEDAPGLEIVAAALDHVVPLAKLADDRVHAQFAQARFVAPVLAPGDILLLTGAVLHRTHVTAAMQQDRTSVEIRFFGQTPALGRLARDRFVPLGATGERQ